MKKNYIQPSVESVQQMIMQPLCLSGVTGNNGMGYGGTDEEGEIDPDVKGREDFFDPPVEQGHAEKYSLW